MSEEKNNKNILETLTNTCATYENKTNSFTAKKENNNNTALSSTITKISKFEFDFPKELGKLGLKNLGNTCYMNVALQVLSHTKELVIYFIKDEFKKDLENRISYYDFEETLRSDFVVNFANFIKEEWSVSKKDLINPLELRSSLVKLYPQFSENTQQDAHEVLICILDSLHQQLNRKENKDDLIMDNELIFNSFASQQSFPLTRHLSQKCWDSHLEMNDSVITDLFFGQLRSTIKCLSCKFENFSFDPFSCLGLPIPNEYKIMIYFIPIKKNSKPVKLFVKTNDNMQFKNLIGIVKSNLDFKFHTGIFYFVLNNKLIKLVHLDESCGDLMSRPAFLFLIESSEEEEDVNKVNAEHVISHNENSNEVITKFDYNIDNDDTFYFCLNFNMYEHSNGSTNMNGSNINSKRSTNNTNSKESVKENSSQIYNAQKVASFPRVFSFNYSSLIKEDPEILVDILDDKKIILKVFNSLLNYITRYIQFGNSNGTNNEDFKDLYDSNLMYFTVRSVEKISYPETLNTNYTNNTNNTNNSNNTNNIDTLNLKKFICLFCDRENSESFVCNCINKIIIQRGFTFDSSSDTNFSTASLVYYIKNRKANSEFILDLNVNISTEVIKYKELNKCKDNTQKYQQETRLNLLNLLDYFTAEEKLTLQDNYYCNNCQMNVVAYKKMEVNKFPQILAINLKRFRYENVSNFGRVKVSRRNDNGSVHRDFGGEKNESLIEFPLNTLDLCKYNKNSNAMYELYAVCNHIGKLDSGHYTAICKHPTTKKWVEYDDKIIRNERSPESIVSSNAYMLFYRKK